MKKIKLLVVLAVLVMFFSTCDENDPSMDDTEDVKPEPTAVGFPNGIPVSKTIGAGGGTVSIDGEVEIEIPAGALSADTEITIQPLTNNAPNGNGNAYRLGPEGTTFSKTVKLTFPYTPIVDGPEITRIAFQDDDGIWYSNGKLSWNKTNNTVTTETTHFSDWATFDALMIICEGCQGTPGSYELKVGESADFQVRLTELAEDELTTEVLPLGYRNYDMDLIMDEWYANGEKNGASGQYGTITPNSNGCVYKAPDKEPKRGKNPVSLMVTLKDLKYKDPRTGTIFNDLQLFTNVKIQGDHKYELEINYFSGVDFTGGLIGATFIVKDHATVQVVTKDDRSIICSDTVNSPGVVFPDSKTDPMGNKSTVTSDTFLGPINVTQCEGRWHNIPGKPSQLVLTVKGTSEGPAFEWVSAFGGSESLPKSTGILMQIFFFDVSDSIPIWKNPQDIMTAKLTRKD